VADSSFKAALELDPHETRALRSLKTVRQRAQDSKRASLPKWSLAANRAQSRGDILTAARHWLNILELDPLNEGARAKLAQNKRLLIQNAQSLANSEPRGENDNSERMQEARRLYTLGLIMFSEGDLAKSVRHLKSSLELNPNDEYTQKALSRVQRELAFDP
jgi:tetratricopeptide (TPR) repeat protein